MARGWSLLFLGLILASAPAGARADDEGRDGRDPDFRACQDWINRDYNRIRDRLPGHESAVRRILDRSERNRAAFGDGQTGGTPLLSAGESREDRARLRAYAADLGRWADKNIRMLDTIGDQCIGYFSDMSQELDALADLTARIRALDERITRAFMNLMEYEVGILGLQVDADLAELEELHRIAGRRNAPVRGGTANGSASGGEVRSGSAD